MMNEYGLVVIIYFIFAIIFLQSITLMKPAIIFDFDGTIADSFGVIKNILLNLSDDFGYKKPTDKQINLLRTKHPKEIMRILGLSYFKLPFLIHRVDKEIQRQIAAVKPIEGIKEVLIQLKSQHYLLGMVTSANEKNVSAFLKNNDLEVFDFIQTGSSIFGKARILKKVLKKQKIGKKEVLYVGDEIRDIEAARKVGIKMIAVTWGFNNREGLQQFHPDVLIDTPSELLVSLNAIREL